MKSQNYINGQWVGASDGKTFAQLNPADLEHVTGEWPQGTSADAEQAIEAAHAAFPAWADMGVYQRAEYLSRAVAVLKGRAEEIAAILTAENGKTLDEARTEIGSAVREMEFQIAQGISMCGQTAPSAQAGVFAYSVRRPLGVASIISPWNFPFNVPGRKCTPALISGNTIVFKPASLTPGAGRAFVDIFAEAGLPPGVLNFVCGGGSTVGETMITHPLVQSISFTGSTQVGRGIQQRAAQGIIRTQLEMGGKNPAVILADADLDMAADAVVKAAYACAGQWCTSTSRAIAEREVAAAFTDKVLERVKQIRVGNGTEDGVDMGPVCGTDQLETIEGYIEIGKAEGALHRARRRAPDRQRTRQRVFYCADGLYQCPAADAHRSGGNLRPGVVPNGSRGFLRGPRNRQWRGVWAGVVHFHAGHWAGFSVFSRDRRGADARQHDDGLPRTPALIRRGQGFRARDPGIGRHRDRIFHRAQGRLYQLSLIGW